MKQIDTDQKTVVDGKEVVPVATMVDGDDVYQIWKNGAGVLIGREVDGVITTQKPKPKPKKYGISIIYVGRRSPQREPQFGTGEWESEQAKVVPPDIAVKLIKEYPGLFVKAPKALALGSTIQLEEPHQVVHHETPKVSQEVNEAVAEKAEEEGAEGEIANEIKEHQEKERQAQEEEAKLQEARDLVNAMDDLDQLRQYAKTNFNQSLPPAIKKIETARNSVIALIDQYGLP